jgi:signal peptidase I
MSLHLHPLQPQIGEMAQAGPEVVSAQAHIPARPKRSFWRTSSGRLLTAAIVLFAVRTFVGEASVVPTGSMEGTILVGDHLFLDKLLYGPEVPLTNWHLPRLKTIRRGDIIVFRYPRNPSEAFLKRVVAVAGDQVEIRDSVVYIDSRPLREPYAVHRGLRSAAREQMAPLTVPKNSLFVMGDNRDNSSDSREWGFVPADNVIGEPMFVYWSYDAPSSRWLDPKIGGQMSFYASIAANFFSHTRWSRMGIWL